MLHEVLRKFRGNGIEYLPGQIVETAEWRNIDSLLRSRYLGTPRKVATEKLVPVNVQTTKEAKAIEPKPATSTISKRPEEAEEAKPVASRAPVTRTATIAGVPPVGKVPTRKVPSR